MVAFAHRVWKPDDAFLINITDEAAAFTAVGTTDFAAIAVLLKMKTILTHGYPDYCCLHSALLHFGLY